MSLGWRRTFVVVVALGVACKGGGNDSVDASECGNLDGSGTDTGDIPSIRGSWTSSFGNGMFQEDCGIGGMKQEDMQWINGGAMVIGGEVPDQLFAEVEGEDGEIFWGVMNDFGGVLFTGIHRHDGYEMRASFGGQLYFNEHLDTTRIEGAGYFGVDSNDDGSLDCHLSGDFIGNKSGS